jgi:HAD superfamily hydrolase (TIGR01662 family)
MTRVKAVLFNRDRVLLRDAPRSADDVRPAPGAAETLWQLRRHGLRTGVVTRRGQLTETETRRVDTRVDELLGPFDVWAVCPHAPDENCRCYAPEPALLLWAAGRLCTAPDACALVGETDADAEAAHRAGARALLLGDPPTAGEPAADVLPDLTAVARALVPDGDGHGEGDGTGEAGAGLTR